MKHAFVTSIAFCLGAAVPILAAQPVLEPETQVSGQSPFLACTLDGVGLPGSTAYLNSEVEPWVSVNPNDPLHMVATWQSDRWNNGGARGLSVGVTFNGGADWEEAVIPGLSLCSGGSFLRATDPWVSFAPNGDLHAVALVFDRGIFVINGILATKSTDGGLTWGQPKPLAASFTPFHHDKEAVTADPSDPNLVYVVWQRVNLSAGGGPTLLARSVDGGDSWEATRMVYDPGPTAQTLGNQIVSEPGGRLHLFFSEIDSPDIFNFTISIASKWSDDRGLTWHPSGSAPRHHEISPRTVIDPDRSLPVWAPGFIFDVAVDRTNGNLYLAWQDSAPSNFRYSQVVFSMSQDSGLTWSDPIVVNKTPPDTNFKLNQAFLPSVHVTDAGVVGVSYFDFRNNGLEPEAMTDHWLVLCNARSADCSAPAGWTEEVRITDLSFDMSKAPTARGLFIGDYVGLASAGNDLVAVYSKPHGSDQASVFARKVILPPEEVIDPQGLGWWRRQVRVANGGKGRADHAPAELKAFLEAIHSSHDLFDGIADLAALEMALDPSLAGDHAGRARVHLMALLLNVASGHLTGFSEIATGGTVEQTIRNVVETILDESSSESDLNAAKDLAEAVNEGLMFLE